MRDDVPLCRGGEGYVEKVRRKLYDEGTAVDNGPGGIGMLGDMVTQGYPGKSPSVLD